MTKLQIDKINLHNLNDAIKATSEKRGSTEVIKRYRDIIQVVKNSNIMNQRWEDYRKDFDYAAGIKFEDTCNAITAIMDKLLI